MSFESRATQMGLTDNGDGTFTYQDVYGITIYKKLSTPNEEIPYIALFSGQNSDDIKFRAILSSLYKFEGHETILNSIRDSINRNSSNNNILRENLHLSSDITLLYNEMVINNSTQFELGTIYPSFVVFNSYNGTRKKEIAFGLNIEGERSENFGIGLKHRLGSISQIHSETHPTLFTNVIGDYIEVFSNNITEVVNTNFQNELSTETILSTLGYVEKLGKRRRHLISQYLSELDKQNISSWDLFLTILKFSCKENNLNAKIEMQNLAERTLVLPQRMISAVKEISHG